MFINPLMWIITIAYFVFRTSAGPFIESLFPTPVFYMAVFSLVFGNFLYLYYYMIGCAKREQDDIIKYVFLVPFYWLAMSLAAWVALYQFIAHPHHWAKTKHGLHLNHVKALKECQISIGRDLVSPVYVTCIGDDSLNRHNGYNDQAKEPEQNNYQNSPLSKDLVSFVPLADKKETNLL